MLRGDNVMRILWLPDSDLLEGECHCGARRVEEAPAPLWEWLLAHPEGHHPAAPREPITAEPRTATASPV
nr:hypothetical protein [Rhodococcus sp. FXJ9.536]